MTANESWAREFFTGLFVDFWLAATTPEQTRLEADFLLKVLAPPASGKLLDLACGGGRHSLELTSRGYALTGVDISAEFLADARLSAENRHLAVDWQQRPITDLHFPGNYDGAFCMGNALTGLDDDDHMKFFRGVAAALKPGAKFVIDTGVIAESILPTVKDRPWWELGDYRLLVVNTYDALQSRLLTQYTVQCGAKTETKSSFSQVYTLREFCSRLSAAGFGEFAAYSSMDLEPFQLKSPQLFLVATRR